LARTGEGMANTPIVRSANVHDAITRFKNMRSSYCVFG
jgi:hypothetical protein